MSNDDGSHGRGRTLRARLRAAATTLSWEIMVAVATARETLEPLWVTANRRWVLLRENFEQHGGLAAFVPHFINPQGWSLVTPPLRVPSASKVSFKILSHWLERLLNLQKALLALLLAPDAKPVTDNPFSQSVSTRPASGLPSAQPTSQQTMRIILQQPERHSDALPADPHFEFDTKF